MAHSPHTPENCEPASHALRGNKTDYTLNIIDEYNYKLKFQHTAALMTLAAASPGSRPVIFSHSADQRAFNKARPRSAGRLPYSG
jgi:hypothetical protein